jgi:hypothetical protein
VIRRSLLCLWFAAAPVWAQEPVPQPTTPAESVRPESVPAPPAPPSPEQKKFLDGLRIATRGIAQLKDGVGRVTRTQRSSAAAARRAGRFLAGYCSSSRAFLKRGRPQMNPTVYDDTTRVKARRLVTQIDSLISYTPNCEQSAAAAPNSTAVEVTKRMKTYDSALRDFRLAVGLPVKDDTSKTVKRQ